jgi:hypothetical protein
MRQQLIGDANVDITFEQRFANASERLVEVLLGELPLAAQVFENALQLVS